MKRAETIQSIVENLVRCQRPGAFADWQKFDLSRAQAGMLFLLHHHKAASVKQTADFLGISKSAATQLMEPLVAKSLVSRVNDPRDRRIARLSLTESGELIVKELLKHKLDDLRSAITALDHEDIERLYQISQKMAALAHVRQK